MKTAEYCPCGSTSTYNECCGLYIDDAKIPDTAEKLMRSRYTAYTLQDDKYLLATWHPSTRPKDNPSDGDDTTWTNLEILKTENGLRKDTEGIVEFIAKCSVKGTASHIHETSQFVYEDKRWFYVDSIGKQPVKRDSKKVGRNEQCPCGSQKKYKKCCGLN